MCHVFLFLMFCSPLMTDKCSQIYLLSCGVVSLMIDIIFATLDARMTIINTTKISEANHTHPHTLTLIFLNHTHTHTLIFIDCTHTHTNIHRLHPHTNTDINRLPTHHTRSKTTHTQIDWYPHFFSISPIEIVENYSLIN